jgi:hypothetical protein
VKYKENVNVKTILNQLKEKAKKVVWGKPNRSEVFLVFAKSFKEKLNDVKCFDFKDLERFFCKKKI